MFLRGFVVLLFSFTLLGQSQALPRRLVLCVDGISWRDVKVLQEGTAAGKHGAARPVRAFDSGYFPASRLVSSFPSCSDVAWTEMLGNEPLPGYQRSYFDVAANRSVAQNGITTTMEYESQMHWQTEGGFHRALGYMTPVREFKREVRLFINNFLTNSAGIQTYYAMLRTTDDAQHMDADIIEMLRHLDQRLIELQALYRSRTGRNLEILLLSDHGSNHAGPGKRVRVVSFLKRAGYRNSKSIMNSHDVVLPTVGIESWVEIHNAPEETLNLVSRLVHLKGIDIITARMPGGEDEFLVFDRNGARALITRDPVRERYRYEMISGDPLEYGPVLESLRKSHSLDQNGFGSADVWLEATMAHRYPLALERIARAHTSVTSNPATILVSLDNHYVHANLPVFLGSRLMRCGGTHGGLDDLNSNGVLLSNFAPTKDTTSSRLASREGWFAGRKAGAGLLSKVR